MSWLCRHSLTILAWPLAGSDQSGVLLNQALLLPSIFHKHIHFRQNN